MYTWILHLSEHKASLNVEDTAAIRQETGNSLVSSKVSSISIFLFTDLMFSPKWEKKKVVMLTWTITNREISNQLMLLLQFYLPF